jgi:hypothetical protein
MPESLDWFSAARYAAAVLRQGFVFRARCRTYRFGGLKRGFELQEAVQRVLQRAAWMSAGGSLPSSAAAPAETSALSPIAIQQSAANLAATMLHEALWDMVPFAVLSGNRAKTGGKR